MAGWLHKELRSTLADAFAGAAGPKDFSVPDEQPAKRQRTSLFGHYKSSPDGSATTGALSNKSPAQLFHDVGKPTGVMKLCVTRWLARTPALQAYDALHVFFAEFGDTNSSSATVKANGIAALLDKFVTYMGIYVSLLVFGRAEQASRRCNNVG